MLITGCSRSFSICRYSFVKSPNQYKDVSIYVVDTGVYDKHTDFEPGQVVHGYTSDNIAKEGFTNRPQNYISPDYPYKKFIYILIPVSFQFQVMTIYSDMAPMSLVLSLVKSTV